MATIRWQRAASSRSIWVSACCKVPTSTRVTGAPIALPPLRDPTNGLVFPDLNAPPFGGEDFQTNLIMPEPTLFLNRMFPSVSIIRPTATKGAAMGALKALTDDGLFIGQSPAFFALLHDLAAQADAAQRGA